MLQKIHWRAVKSEVLFFTCVFVAMMVFRTTAYGMYHIPSESMLPTLAVGDRIAVNKFAYGYSRHSIPFSIGPELTTPSGRIFSKTPERGDIAVFKHPHTRQTFIKRVIGLPGDEIQIVKGRLYLSGSLVPRTLNDVYRYREHRSGVAKVGRFTETLLGGRAHQILERGDNYRADDFGPVIVPENHLFVMGDNRDNSLDSRFPNPGVGLLPMKFLVGRADVMLFSVTFSRKESGLQRHTNIWFSQLR